MSRHPRSVAFVGGGSLASAMARALAAQEFRVSEFVLRAPKAADPLRALARKLGARVTTLDTAKFDAGLLWIAVPDDAIEAVAKRLAKRDLDWRGKIALHSAGALGSEALAPLRRAGASVGSLHPMMSFPSVKARPDLRGVYFALEGDAAAVRFARGIVEELGGKLLRVDARHKALYHAFGAVIAPLLVGHLAAAEKIARGAGVDARFARAAMKPIVEKVVEAYLAGGAEAAFSGPFKRGDVKTIERHLKALGASDEAALYRALATYTVEHIAVANRAGLKKTLERKNRS